MRNPLRTRWGGPRLLSPLRSVTTSLRSAAPLLLAALALSLAACQDPSGVGLSLIGDETSDPNAQLVSTDEIVFGDETAVTGGFANGSGSPVQTRAYVGNLADAATGDIRATAYLDARAVSVPEGFRDRPLAQVQLLLRRATTHGDTLADVQVELRPITSNPGWSPDGLPPDTVLATGDLITAATIPARDTLVTLDLPAAYITANTVLLRDSLDTLFEGFQVRVPDGMTSGAVFGINATESSIRVIGAEYVNSDDVTTRDTVNYPLVEVYTALARGDAMDTPGRMLLRGGASQPLALSFDLSAFDNLPLASSGLRVPLDRSLLQGAMGFNRPMPSSVTLVAVFEDGTRQAILNEEVAADADEVVFRDGPGTSQAFNTLIQSVLLGRLTLDRLEIVIPNSPLGLGILPVMTEDEVQGELRRPRLSLVVIGGPA